MFFLIYDSTKYFRTYATSTADYVCSWALAIQKYGLKPNYEPLIVPLAGIPNFLFVLLSGLTQNVPNVGANGIACGNIRVRPYDTIEVITFLCVSPDFMGVIKNGVYSQRNKRHLFDIS
jgi:hypothetical protein